ncbi:hypothetical protein [Gorillibacterium sp. sgz5001074]|uniref:hypothetical protein n=1 Tax=Gorillibacterium sp. sgz5001074 TaxID=3446695 RepID=UPI003F679119
MYKLMLFLHLLASTGMGFYLFLPFLVGRLGGKADAAQAGFAGLLVTFNRVGQYLLIAQLLTGGYLIGQGSYSHVWAGVIGVLFLAMAAMAGMLGGPLKRLRDSLSQNKNAGTDAGKIRTFGVLIGVLYFVILLLMKYPEWF